MSFVKFQKAYFVKKKMPKFQKYAWKIKHAIYHYSDVIAKKWDKCHLQLICFSS